MKEKLIISVLLLLTLGCQKKSASNDLEASYPRDLEFSLISKGNLLGNGREGIESGSIWITREVEWNDLLGKMNIHNPVSDSFIENTIDFSAYDVLASFDQIRPHTGFVVYIDKLIEEQNNRVAHLVLKENNTGFDVVSQPYYLIKIPKSKKTVMFQ